MTMIDYDEFNAMTADELREWVTETYMIGSPTMRQWLEITIASQRYEIRRLHELVEKLKGKKNEIHDKK